MVDAPAASVPNSPAHSPCTWKSGSVRMSRSSGCQPQAARSACDAGQQRRVGVDRSLGSAGGARRVHDQGVVIGSCRVERRCRRRRRRRRRPRPPHRSHRAPARHRYIGGLDPSSMLGRRPTRRPVARHPRRSSISAAVAAGIERHEHGAGAQHGEQRLDGVERRRSAHQSTRSPGRHSACGQDGRRSRRSARARARPVSTARGVPPSTSTARSGSARQRADHSRSERARPARRARPGRTDRTVSRAHLDAIRPVVAHVIV